MPPTAPALHRACPGRDDMLAEPDSFSQQKKEKEGIVFPFLLFFI
jgi:hypothetical protein